MTCDPPTGSSPPRFDRHFFEGKETFTTIGGGALGGKASGLLVARETLADRADVLSSSALEISVPTLTILATDAFDRFLSLNRLHDLVYSGEEDRVTANSLQRADLPAELVGDLWDLIRQVHTPLAVRSSSLMEDDVAHPFAGVYATKMIPNNQPSPELRFRKLVEAIKFVYASTFFRDARDYLQAAGRSPQDEKMAIVIQEVVGRRHGDRFYPDLSGVARSMNFYPIGRAKPEEGVMELALGLGKTIVDGGRTWTCSPAFPRIGPPFGSVAEILRGTQTEFWAVNMGKPPEYDPVTESEYLSMSGLSDAEADGTLTYLASTFDPQSDRVSMGLRGSGPRVLTFAPLLEAQQWPLAETVRKLLEVFAERLGSAVEIEFALTFPSQSNQPARLGFLQVRPMAVALETVEVGLEELGSADVIVASPIVMGNGVLDNIRDIVFVKPDVFDAGQSPAIAEEIEIMNTALTAFGRPYLLLGFGRWGSSEPWLGIPLVWSQISGARCIVEANLPEVAIDMSQGSHFFHNLLSFGVSYFSVPNQEPARIDWQWLMQLPRAAETSHVCRVELPDPLLIRVDGRNRRGVVLRPRGYGE
jgi:hypothetical protein